jgi:3D (Asp-Asp-Asp) domain-containing protein
MQRFISRSNTRRALATVTAITLILLVYQATMNESLLPFTGRSVDPTAPVPGARLQFSATAYCKGTTTASGVNVRTGIAAADRTLLPVGSVVTVTTDNPRYNGVYTVMDTGPAVQGRILDLYMWSCHEALAFGRKQIQVEVLRLGWNPNASTPGLIDRIFRRPPQRREPVVPEVAPPATTTPPPDEPVEEELPATGATDPVAPAADTQAVPPAADAASAP